MAIAQPTGDNMGGSDALAAKAALAPSGATSPSPTPSPTGTGARGNPDPLADIASTPPGWHPIELSLPVPGSTTPYHFNAQSAADLGPQSRAYGDAVRTGAQGLVPNLQSSVQGLIGQPFQQVESQLGAGHPLLQHFFDYLRQLVESRGQGQFRLPGGAGQPGPIEAGPRPITQPGQPHPLDGFFSSILNGVRPPTNGA